MPEPCRPYLRPAATTIEAILAKWKSEDERKKSHYEEWVASLKLRAPTCNDSVQVVGAGQEEMK